MGKSVNNLDTSFFGHPKPLFSLSFTELWERFSFYGVRPLFYLFMIASLEKKGMNLKPEEASAIMGIFASCLYLSVLPGGWLADNYLGQKKAILIGALIIAFGHLCIAFSYFDDKMIFIGMLFLVIGTGLFKTCASVMVGMLYKKDDTRRDSGFTLFYMCFNFGAFIAPIICGFLQKEYGWHFGFGAGGIGMLLAVIIFYFKTIPDLKEFDKHVGIEATWDKPSKKNKNAFYIIVISSIILIGAIFLLFNGFIKLDARVINKNIILIILACAAIYFLYLFTFTSLRIEEKRNLIVFVVLFFAAALFWSVYEQQYTSFNFFAEKLTNKTLFNYEFPVVWFQSFGGLFVILFAPLSTFIWTYCAKNNKEISSIVKFALGLFGAALAFLVMALASNYAINLNGGADSLKTSLENSSQIILVSPWWLVSSFLLLVLGELCLSPVGLSIMTKIAPELIKSQVMGLWFVASALGNALAGFIGGEASEENIAYLPNLFLECMWILLGAAIVLFILKKSINKMLKNNKGKK
ncbi:peptide MFS transporter [Campylobacter aviculae]|uniref:MFS transporter n=1 Tax=Campylobacter aviculae TaxID=2510190 RepID=A0A4U7BPY0_9BACT|nr:peptide MFS transporter [Campylobacter aviculae]TKX32290.1 MFS transporter [Campylobacter aviculae]